MEAIRPQARPGQRMKRVAIALLPAIGLSGCAHHVKPPGPGIAPSIPLTLACTATPGSLYPGEPLTLTATAEEFKPAQALSFQWKAADGAVIGSSSSVSVPTSQMPPGSQTFTATATNGRGESAACGVSVTIRLFEPPTLSCAQPFHRSAGWQRCHSLRRRESPAPAACVLLRRNLGCHLGCRASCYAQSGWSAAGAGYDFGPRDRPARTYCNGRNERSTRDAGSPHGRGHTTDAPSPHDGGHAASAAPSTHLGHRSRFSLVEPA